MGWPGCCAAACAVCQRAKCQRTSSLPLASISRTRMCRGRPCCASVRYSRRLGGRRYSCPAVQGSGARRARPCKSNDEAKPGYRRPGAQAGHGPCRRGIGPPRVPPRRRPSASGHDGLATRPTVRPSCSPRSEPRLSHIGRSCHRALAVDLDMNGMWSRARPLDVAGRVVALALARGRASHRLPAWKQGKVVAAALGCRCRGIHSPPPRTRLDRPDGAGRDIRGPPHALAGPGPCPGPLFELAPSRPYPLRSSRTQRVCGWCNRAKAICSGQRLPSARCIMCRAITCNRESASATVFAMCGGR